MTEQHKDDQFARDLGERLRQMREAQGMNQAKLAEFGGVTKSFVSQLERGKVMPSIATIRRLTGALGCTLATLFGEVTEHQPDDHVVVRANRRRSIRIAGKNVELLLLAPDAHRAMEPLYNVLQPGQATCEEPMAHEGEEWLYIIKGVAKLILGEDQLLLAPGDTAYFTSKVRHQVINVGDGPLEIIWVVTPPQY